MLMWTAAFACRPAIFSTTYINGLLRIYINLADFDGFEMSFDQTLAREDRFAELAALGARHQVFSGLRDFS